jgi:integrase/recombinase XerD
VQAKIEAFLGHLVAEGRSSNTQTAYGADLRGFYSFLQATEPQVDSWQSVTGLHLVAYVARLQEQGSRPATLSRKAVVLGRFFDFLGKELPPLESLPASTPMQPPVFLSPEKVDALLAQMAASTASTARRDRALLALLWETGAQVSEVVGLNWGDFDSSTAGVVLDRDGSRQRTATLSPAAADAMRGYLSADISGTASLSRQKPLLRNQRGRRLTRQGVWLILRGWGTKAGITEPLTPRLLLRGRTAHLLQTGIDQQAIDNRVGVVHPLLLDGLPPAADTTVPSTSR